MPLTSMLKASKGPLRVWWDQELPNLRSITGAGLWKQALAAPPPPSALAAAGLVGTAIDYRVRWLWPHTKATDLLGVNPGALNSFGVRRARQFADEVDAVASGIAGPLSWDISGSNGQLARLALVLAHLETVYRIGLPLDPATTGVHGDVSLEEMMAAQRSDLVTDINEILAAGRRNLEPILSGRPILNPVFNQSALVSGADTDFVIDSTLIELKSTRQLSMDSNDLRQLVTYALLDDIDEHQIRSVALFYIRRPQYLKWDLDDLLSIAGSTKSRRELTSSLIRGLEMASGGPHR